MDVSVSGSVVLVMIDVTAVDEIITGYLEMGIPGEVSGGNVVISGLNVIGISGNVKGGNVITVFGTAVNERIGFMIPPTLSEGSPKS